MHARTLREIGAGDKEGSQLLLVPVAAQRSVMSAAQASDLGWVASRLSQLLDPNSSYYSRELTLGDTYAVRNATLLIIARYSVGRQAEDRR